MTEHDLVTLAALDVAEFRRSLVRGGAPAERVYAADDFTMLAAMHKTRYAMPGVADDLRQISAAWLRLQGMGGPCGVPLLPPGELPS